MPLMKEISRNKTLFFTKYLTINGSILLFLYDHESHVSFRYIVVISCLHGPDNSDIVI
jgi:hypothetical protein